MLQDLNDIREFSSDEDEGSVNAAYENYGTHYNPLQVKPVKTL